MPSGSGCDGTTTKRLLSRQILRAARSLIARHDVKGTLANLRGTAHRYGNIEDHFRNLGGNNSRKINMVCETDFGK
jgi:hypothetical protein